MADNFNDSTDMTGLLDIVISRNNSVHSNRYDEPNRSLSIPSLSNIFSKPEIDNSNDNDKRENQSDDYEENDELCIIPDRIVDKSSQKEIKSIYQHPLAKTVASIGSIDISIGKAKLFGIVNDKNEIKLPTVQLDSSEITNKKEHIDRITQLHTRRKILPSIPNEPVVKFKKIADKTTLDAALERLTNPSSDSNGVLINGVKYTKAQLDSMEQDYKYKLNKYQCPKCEKYQSFTEYMEKKRMCSQCNVRYEKLNVTTGSNYHKLVKTMEEKKLAKIKQIEEEMYGEMERNRNKKYLSKTVK